jgi:Arc/MetJ-type ribon-helix-helix transcriptional regulator
MPEILSPEVERLVQQHVDGQRFTSPNDVILVAMRLFNEFQDHYQEELGAAIKRGFGQIGRGEGIELKDDAALSEFFDDLKRRGRERYEARRTA